MPVNFSMFMRNIFPNMIYKDERIQKHWYDSLQLKSVYSKKKKEIKSIADRVISGMFT